MTSFIDSRSPSNGYNQTSVGVVIPAAGLSRRMGGSDNDKLSAQIGGQPVLAHTIERFNRLTSVGRIVVVVRKEILKFWSANVRENGWEKVVEVISGGARRQDSVLIGLRALDGCQWVMVHDGARPCVTPDIIDRGLDAAEETGAAIAAVPVKDTIKSSDGSRFVIGTPRRDTLWAVQTPQIFRYDLLLGAYEGTDQDVTDDASLVERSGHRVKLFMGAYTNIKITTPEDLWLAERFLTGSGGSAL